MTEEESLEVSSESRHKGCRRDMLQQTVQSRVTHNNASDYLANGLTDH